MSIEDSYLRQAEAESVMSMPTRYTNPGSIDNWRHTRMLSMTRPLISAMPKSSWMTVGDGRYGSDAAYLEAQGVDVLATSLTDDLLKIAYEAGFISKYQSENAEHLSPAENSVDFVLCKESYHHFPRPPIALYEMLRVSKVGVVLIEPIDNSRPLDRLKVVLKRLIRGDHEMNFEPSGNFIYKPSVAELSKLLTAMGGRYIAVKKFNDFFHPKFGNCDAASVNMGSTITKLGILAQDGLAKLGLMGYGLGSIIIFKGVPSAEVVESVRAASYGIIELPINPYPSVS
ncbi:MAG: class I SAM-dependent methyltransferase [Gallionella sp.]|nr:class I SAM-dependent methyltransferase [Gallionella sp.]